MVKPIPGPSLGELRQAWTYCIARLILYIRSEGYDCSMSEGFIGDTARHSIAEVKSELLKAGVSVAIIDRVLAGFDPTPHREDGGHLKGIAGDINIFKNGVWLNKGNEPIWPMAGRYWKSLHLRARWNPNDANHFGFEHNGVF